MIDKNYNQEFLEKHRNIVGLDKNLSRFDKFDRHVELIKSIPDERSVSMKVDQLSEDTPRQLNSTVILVTIACCFGIILCGSIWWQGYGIALALIAYFALRQVIHLCSKRLAATPQSVSHRGKCFS